jgi:hypothetical protein
MTRTLLIGLLTLAAAASAQAADRDTVVTTVGSPDGARGIKNYPANREPLAPSPLVKLPVGAVVPEGWIREQLRLEAEGFSGRLSEISGFLKKENNAWLSPKGDGHSPWEELPYWLKGFVDLGYVLGDQRIIDEARPWIEALLASQREDGWFGPRANLNPSRSDTPGKPDLWPNMLALNALQSYCEYAGDKRVLDLMARYFRWELAVPEKDFLPPFWQQQRAGDNLASVYWLYNRTGDKRLLELATKIHRSMARWDREIASWHGVNICQCFRSPAVYWMQSRNPKDLEAVERNYLTVRGMYGQVPGGMFGADENCRPGYGGPRQAAESCSIAEMMLSDELMVSITGDPLWADRCEDVALNSFPACMTADLKGLRYLTAPNQVLSDRLNKSPGVQNGGPMFLFNPHDHRCCQHNIAHGWPRYVQHFWMAAAGDGLAAVLYGPCRVKVKVADGTEVAVAESTKYPFDENVEMTLSSPKPVKFPLYLRVPGWCDVPAVTINGQPLDIGTAPRGWLRIHREWKQGDRLRLALPMKVALTEWKKNKGSVSVHRGPLTYSLKIGERYVRAGGTDKWPALEAHPATPWNYGLVLDGGEPFEVVRKDWDGSGQPFSVQSAPIELKVKAKKIPAWTLDHLGLVGPLCQSLVKSDEPTETVALIPMGCARLRIASFPTIGSGPDAHDWTEPARAPHKASHCFESDTVMALSDGLEPKNSNDHSIPRFTWWPRRGTSEWVTCEFDKPRKVSGVEVYWFDDTGAGQCRVPKSWRLEYRDGAQWKAVGGKGPYGTEADKFNAIAFEPVTAKEFRITVQLKPDLSGGILEWRVK